jgi:hypothetical protein
LSTALTSIGVLTSKTYLNISHDGTNNGKMHPVRYVYKSTFPFVERGKNYPVPLKKKCFQIFIGIFSIWVFI